MLDQEELDDTQNSIQNIYVSVDHLKQGHYIINIMLNDKIIKSIKINKT